MAEWVYNFLSKVRVKAYNYIAVSCMSVVIVIKKRRLNQAPHTTNSFTFDKAV